jgi:hypothetical protein
VFALQNGHERVLEAKSATGEAIVFDFPVKIADAGALPPRLTGSFTHGPPGARFVYVNSGVLAKDAGSQWMRRARVPLGSISQELITQLASQPRCVLSATIAGKSMDGGPCCATVPLLVPWQIEAR